MTFLSKGRHFSRQGMHVCIIRVSADSQCDSMWSELVFTWSRGNRCAFHKDQETDWVFTEQTQILEQLVQRGKKLFNDIDFLLENNLLTCFLSYFLLVFLSAGGLLYKDQ